MDYAGLFLLLVSNLMFTFGSAVLFPNAWVERQVPVRTDRVSEAVFDVHPLGKPDEKAQLLTTDAVPTTAVFQCDGERQFNCGANGIDPPQCISSIWRCDGEFDCRSGADEKNCDWNDNQECTTDTHRCGDGTCLHASWVCDSDSDCSDASDEENCTEPTVQVPLGGCGSLRFTCANSEKCIPLEWKCDNQNDCSDGSDETNCSSNQWVLAPKKTDGRMFNNYTINQLKEPSNADAILLPVQNLVMSITSDTCAVLKWTRPPVPAVVSDYLVQETSNEIKSFRSNGSTRVSVCNLRAGVTYTFHVKAMNRRYKSPALEVHGKMPDHILPHPFNLTVVALDSSTTAVTWELSPETPMSARVVLYYRMDGPVKEWGVGTRIVLVNRTQTVVSGLVPCGVYSFRVRVEGPTVFSDFSEWVQSNISVSTEFLRAPTNVRAETGLLPAVTPGFLASKATATVYWDVPDLPLACAKTSFSSEYKLYFINYTRLSYQSLSDPEFAVFVGVPPGSNGNHTRDGMHRGQNYSVRVRFAIEEAEWSDPVHFQTESYEAPANFTVYQAENGWFVLTWSALENTTGLTFPYQYIAEPQLSLSFRISMRKSATAGAVQNYVAPENYTALQNFRVISVPVVVGEQYFFQVAAVDYWGAVGEHTPEQSVVVKYEMTSPPAAELPENYFDASRLPPGLFSSTGYTVPSVVLVVTSLLLAL